MVTSCGNDEVMIRGACLPKVAALDLYTSSPVVRPVATPRLRYDLDIKRKGDSYWVYVNSSDDSSKLRAFVGELQNEQNMAGWRILEAGTGKVVARKGRKV